MLFSHELATFSLLITINHIQNCGTKYWNLIFSLFINFLLWCSVQFYSHRYISKTKNIYSLINQILQLKKKKQFIHSLGAEQMQSFSLWLWPFTLKFPTLDRWCILKSWHEWCYIVSVMRIYIPMVFSFSLQCWSIYPKFQFSLFINFLLWSSVQFYSHRYISKTKNIYSFINQILQLKKKNFYTP